MTRRFWHSLIAVVLGNIVYFSLLPTLPEVVRHKPYRLDWGLAFDFWLCLVFYGLLNLVKWFRPQNGGSGSGRS